MVTTQNVNGKQLRFHVQLFTYLYTALGPVDPELDLASLGPLHLNTINKSRFSMHIPEVATLLKQDRTNVVLMGIEVRSNCILIIIILTPCLSHTSASYKQLSI